MICQIKSVKAKTGPLPGFEKDLSSTATRAVQPVHINDGLSWSPITAGPYLVPVSRWVE